MSDLQAIDRYLQQSQPEHMESLKSLLRIPSVSADPAFNGETRQAAMSVLATLKSTGIHTELIETDGPPLVYAETPAVAGKAVVLVYGHYEVQPPDPLDEWITPPFEPTERDGNLYARGATDDKGQVLTHIHSVAAWLKNEGGLPLQIKFLIEGEEEVGSEQFEKYIQTPAAADKLACDVIVISDGSQYADGQPAITYGLRGIAYYELRLTGPKQDLHSGSFGGAVNNPSLALSKFLASSVDDSGRIQLPGFYDSVLQLSDEERKLLGQLDFSDANFAKQMGVDDLVGEAGYTTLERRWARPTYDVHGLWGGYSGEGGKTIIPAKAAAKISFRLVPNQTPDEVSKQLKQFVAENTPPGIKVKLVDLHGGPGMMCDINSPYIAASQRAIETAFGTQAVLIREGGSIPIVSDMVNKLDADVLLLGWGLDDDGAHSPNEKFKIADYFNGIRASAHLWQCLADTQ